MTIQPFTELMNYRFSKKMHKWATLRVPHPPFLKFLAVIIKSEIGFAESLNQDDLSLNYFHCCLPFFFCGSSSSLEDLSLIANDNYTYVFHMLSYRMYITCLVSHGYWQLDHFAVGELQPYKVLMIFVTETESTGRRLSQTVRYEINYWDWNRALNCRGKR